MYRVKSFIKRHRNLLRIANFILRKRTRIAYISEATQFAFAADWAKRLPYFDVYVGIPRKGLVIAAIIATLKGRPLSTPEHFVDGQAWFHSKVNFDEIATVLLVEDSGLYAKELTVAKKMIANKYPRLTIKTACLKVDDKAFKSNYDYHYAVSNGPVMLEGSLLTTTGGSFGDLATDMDGVLCEDCPASVVSGTPEYLEWIRSVKPLLIPNFEILAIITSRLDIYKNVTEDWLRRNGVRTKQLYMRESELESASRFKARIIRRVKPKWYWESSLSESIDIAKSAKIQVFCVEQNRIVDN